MLRLSPLLLLAAPALAHHPLNGMPMETFGHGILSGIGHPILGVDHLFFVAAAGVAAAVAGARYAAPLAYLGAMVAGVVLVLGGIALPAVEFAIAASLVLIGAAAILRLPAAAVMALLAAAGLFHGCAFGETLAGQEGGAPLAVTLGYLIGLAAVQYLIALAAGGAATALRAPQIAGAAVAGVGAFLLLESAEGAILTALGLA